MFCTDTDGGVDIFTKGTVFTWGTYYNDICYSNNTKVFEYSCQPFGYQGDLLACQYGCKDSACLKNPPTPTITPSPTLTPKPKATISPTLVPTSTLTPTPKPPLENELTFTYDGAIEREYKNRNNRELAADVNKIYQAIKKIYGPPYKNITVKIRLSDDDFYNLTTNEIGISVLDLGSPSILIEEIVEAFHDDLIAYLPGIWEGGFSTVIAEEVNMEVFAPERKNQARFYYPMYELVAPNPGWASATGDFLAINDFVGARSYDLLYASLYKPFIEDNQFFVNFNRELYKQPADGTLKDKMPAIAKSVKPTMEGLPFDDWFDMQYILQIRTIPGKFIIPYVEKNNAGKMVVIAKAIEVLGNGQRKQVDGPTVNIHAYTGDNKEVWSAFANARANSRIELGEMPGVGNNYLGIIRFDITSTGFFSTPFYYPYWGGQPFVLEGNPPPGVFGSIINKDQGDLVIKIPEYTYTIGIKGLHGVFSSGSISLFHDKKGIVELSYYDQEVNGNPTAVKKITKDVGDYYTFFRFAKAATSQTRGLPPAPTGSEDIVDGMKLFISEKLGFKIRYPAELFAWEWKSDEQPNFNSEKPDFDKNVVQFFKNADLNGSKITINRYTNPQRKTAKDYAKAYWSASEESLQHWKPKEIDFVVRTVKVQGEGEEKSYLTPLGDWMYIFGASDASLQSTLEKMLPTLEFTGTGEVLSESLTPCPDDLLSTAEQLNKAQENWWEKPDECNNRPEQKVCGYIRSIYDNGIVQVGSQNYRNLYCYCSFFEKDGSRTFRGTGMFSLGYEEGACK